MKKGRIALVLVIVAVVVVAAGIYVWTKKAKERKSQVLVVLPTADNPFWIDMKMGAEQAAAANAERVDVVIRTGQADNDPTSQIQVMRDFLGLGAVDALVLGPGSSTEVVPAVAEYNKSQIPVVVVDSRLDSEELRAQGAHVDTFIGSDNAEGGRLAAEEIHRLLGEGPHSVLLIGGDPIHETAISRAKGFKEGAQPNWTVTEKQANWDRAQARQVMESSLAQEVPDAVFAASDEMALGAVTALEEAQRPLEEWPVIIGFDATEEGLKALSQRKLKATIKQRPFEIGKRAVEIAIARLERQPGQPSDVPMKVEIVRP